MARFKVVEGTPEVEVNDGLVKMLESALKQAKEGKLIACAMTFIDPNYDYQNWFCDNGAALDEIVGGVSQQLFQLQLHVASCTEVIEDSE